MPRDDVDGQPIHTAIARNKKGHDFPSLSARSPFGRHDFVGGNTLVPALLRDHRQDLRPDVPKAAFDAIVGAARRQLQELTAKLEILTAEHGPEGLHIKVRVQNLAGHRLPSSFPGRRMWLRLRLRDAAGQLLWASGEHDEKGRILAANGVVLAAERVGGPVLPHRRVIHDENQVQVYESVPADGQGRRSRTMLGTVGHLKDNRLMPQGWRADGPDAALIAPAGLGGDGDFGAGGDQLSWRLADIHLSVTVEVSLLYQPLGARHLAELLAVDEPEVRQLKKLLDTASTSKCAKMTPTKLDHPSNRNG